jgi:hypothetical protein
LPTAVGALFEPGQNVEVTVSSDVSMSVAAGSRQVTLAVRDLLWDVVVFARSAP